MGGAVSASFDRDAVAREAMGALIALVPMPAFEPATLAVMASAIAVTAYALADAMAKVRGDRSANVAQAEVVTLLPAPAESVVAVAGPPSPVVVCTHDDIPWTAEMIETFAQFRLELWKERSGEAGYWLAERGEASGAAFARFDAVARPLAGARLDDAVLSLPPQVVARAEELIRAEKAP